MLHLLNNFITKFANHNKVSMLIIEAPK